MLCGGLIESWEGLSESELPGKYYANYLQPVPPTNTSLVLQQVVENTQENIELKLSFI